MSDDERFRLTQLGKMSDAKLGDWLLEAPLLEEKFRRDEEYRKSWSAQRLKYAQPAALRAMFELDEDDEDEDDEDDDLADDDIYAGFGFAHGPGAGGVAGLARLASSGPGIHAIIAGLDIVSHGLLQVALWFDGQIDNLEIAVKLLRSPSDDEVDAAAACLGRLFLATVARRPWLKLRRDVVTSVGAPGVSLSFLERLNSEELSAMVGALGLKRPPTKAERVARLRAVMTDRSAVEEAVASTPLASQAVFWRLVSAVEPITYEQAGARYFSSFGSTQYLRRPSNSELEPLARMGLVYGDSSTGMVWTWRELARGFPERTSGLKFMKRDLRPAQGLRPIELDSGRVPSVVADAERVLAFWRREPPPALNDGGLGVAPVRSLAKKLGLPPSEVGVIANVLIRRGALKREVSGYEGRGRNRRPIFAWSAPVGSGWDETAMVDRWVAMVTWWMGDNGLNEWNGAPERLTSETPPDQARIARVLFLRFLLALEPGGGLDPADIAISLWRRYPSVFGPDRVDGMVAVARAVGVVPTAGPVGLTSAARALLMSRFDDIEVADDTSFVVQADHTIVAPQSLRSDLASRLAALADVESEGGAVVWRLTDATVVRALDHGQTGDDIEAFLREHSTKEVPQSVVYFVHDVERRRGRLNIVEAATVVVSDDVALVAQAVRVAGAKLRAVGLHAAVSALPPASVEKALTAKGVLGVKVAAGAPKVTPTRVGLAAVGGPGSALAAPKTGKDLGALADLLTGRASRALARRIRKPST